MYAGLMANYYDRDNRVFTIERADESECSMIRRSLIAGGKDVSRVRIYRGRFRFDVYNWEE